MILQLTRPNSINLKTKNLRQQPLRCRELGKMGLFVTLGALPSHHCGNLCQVKKIREAQLNNGIVDMVAEQLLGLDLFHPFPSFSHWLVTVSD